MGDDGGVNKLELSPSDEQELREMGVSAEQIRADRQARKKALTSPPKVVVQIAPHLAQVVGLFSRLSTHWRAVVGPAGDVLWLGFDWTAVNSTIERLGIKPTHPERFDEWLQVMEAEGLKVKNAG